MTGAAPQGVAQTSPHTPTAREERAVPFPAAQALRTEQSTVPLMEMAHSMAARQQRLRPSTSEYGLCADVWGYESQISDVQTICVYMTMIVELTKTISAIRVVHD